MSARFRMVALALVASLALSGAARRPATVFDLSDAVGKSVPEITLSTTDGAQLTLAVPGKLTYVFLFAGWCAPCVDALPFVRKAYAKYGDRVRFIAVDVFEDADAGKAAVAHAALPFPTAVYPLEQLDAIVAPDVQLKAGTKYRIPADFLIDENGVVRYAWHGLQVTESGDPIDVLPSYLAKLGVQ